MPRISLVLATIGRDAELARFLASLRGQVAAGIELVVVDQSDGDSVGEALRSVDVAGLQVRHLRLSPPNLSAARNLGMAQAQGDIVGFPDDDCWYGGGCLAAVVRVFDAQPQCDGIVIRWVEQHAAQPSMSGQPPRLLLADWRRFRGGDASSITLFLRRSALARSGGFDPRLGVGQWFGSGEETDLVLRLLADGARLDRVEGAEVHHAFASSAAPQRWQQALERARGTGALYRKHRLGWAVVLRGVLAPPLLALAQGWRGLLRGIAVSVGRLQGFCIWKDGP